MNSRFFKLAHDMLCIASPDGTCLHVNPAWTRVLGWPAERIEGHSVGTFVHPDDSFAVADVLRRCAADRFPESHRVRMRTTDGSYRVIDFRTTFDVDAGELLAAGRDVTEEVDMQRRLAAREQKLAEVVSLQTREHDEQFATLAADLHDSAVQHNVAALMFLESAARDAPVPGEDAAEQVRLSLAALRRIMAGLDAVDAGIEDPVVGFREIAHGVASQFDAEIDCVVESTLELSRELRHSAYRIAREGLVNACKHAGRGPIRLLVGVDSELLRIRVEDPGSDVATDHDDIGQGRGLALMGARVRAHGGELSLETASGGSALTVRLPLPQPDQQYPHGGFIAPSTAAM